MTEPLPHLYINSLDSLDEVLAPFRDPRPWVLLSHRQICTNCGSERISPGLIMREESKGRFVRASSPPPQGTKLKDHISPAYFAHCDQCRGERPLAESLSQAIQSAGNDRDLAQRAGHILADWVRRKRMGGTGD